MLALVGATATGKSAVAMALAESDPSVELVSVDSMQVYRGMDIGTAKPTRAEQRQVRHHLIDICDPSDDMSIVEFRLAHDAARADIADRGARAVLVGGTGLYVRAIVDRLTPPPSFPEIVADLEVEPATEVLHSRLAEVDPAAAAKMEPSNRRRVVRALSVTIGTGRPFSSFGPGLDHYPPVDVVLLGVDVDRDLLDRRIDSRYEEQMDRGFLAEVEGLAATAGELGRTASQALGYKELLAHLRGSMSLTEALDLAKARTRRFARRQQRWFRRDPRIEWFHHTGDVTDIARSIQERYGDVINSV